jgi:2-methylisocitrate lyase-like PEP mutase family enzyme
MNVIRAVQEYERAGVAGLHLEDQEFPKRCGHLPGTQVVPAAEFEAKIRAAVHARRDPDLVLIARSDARGVYGLHEVVDRARRYAAAGADVVFAEGLQSVDEVAAVAEAGGVPVMVNQVPGGQSPVLPHDALAAAGCRIAIYPSTTLSASITAMEAALRRLSSEVTDDGTILAPREIFQRVGLDSWRQLMHDFAVPDAGSEGGRGPANRPGGE